MIEIRFNSDRTLENAAGLVPGQVLHVHLPDGNHFRVRRLGPDYEVQWFELEDD